MREQIDMRHESLDDGFDVAIKCIITGISPTTISADVMIHSQLVKLFVKEDCFFSFISEKSYLLLSLSANSYKESF